MKAKIKNSPFVLDVNPFFDNGWFKGYQDEVGMCYAPDQIEFITEHEYNKVSGSNVYITNTNCSTRLLNCLRSSWMFRESRLTDVTMADIAKYAKKDYMRCRNFGYGSYQELTELLAKYGLELKKED